MQMYFILISLVLMKLNSSYGCSMENISNWLLPVTIDIYDIERDVFFRRSTSNIEGINLVTNNEGLNGGPYLTVSYNDSEFTIAPNAEFENYEENETEHSMGVTVSFRCTGGSSNTLIFVINIKDTNNNAPQFMPSDNYHYKVAPPLPPGFLISDCINNLIVRDIDLTTQRIDFEIEENPFFEIVADTPTNPKEFKATLRSTAFIRRISEPIVLWIKATDVDLTGDPPITTNATVLIEADTEFEFPDDLIFSQTFYIATYTNEGNILVENDIYLQEGYDESVNFSLEGDNENLFYIVLFKNQITLRANSQLPTDLLTNQIYLILKASREHTSGASATVIVNLPEGPNFMFEEAYYKGSIVDNSLNIANLVLQEDSDYPDIEIHIYNEFSQYFAASVQNNNVILSMEPLNDEIIQNNNILTLQVVAIANNRTAATVVVLEIIKNDLTTPIFEKNIYNGTYNPILGVTIENITLIQGFDESITVSLEGDFESYFQITRNGNVFNIFTPGLPSHILTEQRLLLTIIATKPRTVGAQAVLYITMPEARALAFKYLTYSGILVNNSVILETIELNVGYDVDVNFDLTGDYANYFLHTNDGNQVTLRISDQIPESVIVDNNNLILTLTAAGNNTEIARTTIILEIIKEDMTTPIFNKNIYHASYLDGTISMENIFLTQGFNDTVIFRLAGDNTQYFVLSSTETNNISISLDTIIPEELIFNEKVLLFTILAEKPFSVGANAAISVNFPRELTEPTVMRFSKSSYIGNITNQMFTIETIVLDQGFQPQTEFLLNGDHASLFNVTNDGNIVTVQLIEQFSEDIIENNNFIILHIEAIHPRTIKAHATIVVEIIRQLEEIVIPPIFERPYYYGLYSVQDKLQFNQTIQIHEGSRENIRFELEGDYAVWFTLTPLDNGVILTLQSPIPSDVLADNQQLIFIVTANVLNTTISAQSTIIIGLINDVDEIVVLEFDKPNFIGTIDNNTLALEPISLVQGFSSDVVFTLQGELASYFNRLVNVSIVTIQLKDTIPDNVVPNNRIIILELVANAPQAVPAYVTIVIEVVRDEIPSNDDILKFTEAYYIGAYNETGLDFNHNITLAVGFDETVEFTLVGENSVWFGIVPIESAVTLFLKNPIPIDVLNNDRLLIFELSASKPSSLVTARSAIIITFTTEENTTHILRFEKNSYLGTVDNISVSLEPIVLTEGFTSDVQFTIKGELANLFTRRIDGAIVHILLEDTLPDEILSGNRVIILELEAMAPETSPTYTTIVLEVVQQNQLPVQVLKFKEAYYTGQYKENDVLEFEEAISLTNESLGGVEYSLQGDNAIWFSLEEVEDGLLVILSTSIPQNIQSENMFLIFIITATKSESIAARSTIVISLPNGTNNTQILRFEKSSYLGTVDNITVNLEPIILVQGFTSDVQFSLNGELANLFTRRIDGAIAHILLEDTLPDEILSGNRVIILQLEATAPETSPTYTTIVLEVVQQNQLPVQVLKFKEAYYTGQYKENDVLEFEEAISLTNESLDGVEYSLQGDNAIWFSLQEVEDGLLVVLSTPIPQNVQCENMFLVFIVTATKPDSIAARSTIVIALPNASEDSNIYFDKLLYRGVIRDNILTHENILVSGYNGTDIEIFGEHVNLFVVQINQRLVTIELRDSATVTVDSSYLILEIRVPGAGCVLQLENIKQEIPTLPTVRFSSESYVIEVDISQTGLIGQVSATADNEESITYSLFVDNDKLKDRLSINSNGELHLTTSVSSGVSTFRVVATTDVTQVNGTATVVLVVESGEEITLPPLIIIERDEESPYNNLVTLNTTFKDCRYEMTNRWPIDQTWLYVDDNGLHTNAIDREDEAIAFMALSQIQVELKLQCDTDESTLRSKRSFNNIHMTETFGPYDYGTYRWVLTDPILFDPRRSFVNLIVNDINDNDPIFVLKYNEPIAVGYPLPELEEIVPPRALAELTATDADIGENAALVYWSSEPALAVSPTTGRVHVSNSSLLQNNARLRISATDRNGVDGRTGYIDLVIRLLDFHQIAVITIQGAFLEDENSVLTNLTNALGYEIKALRSVIIPLDTDANENTRSMRRAATLSNGALLQLYIYGLINREPVEVSQLTSDINNIVMGNIARTVSLEDHLESREICSLPERDTGLLAATIALSILLFIIIVVFAVWFFLKWRKTYNYNNFSDQNSLASRDQIPPTLKIEEPVKPRMNIDELKRSERRLQDILDTPETSTQNVNQTETVVDFPTAEQRMPIVIQSIDKLKDAAETSDDEDEFGETQKARRKSVVTFNENVEKIIHLEDTPSDADYEVYKF